MRIAHGILPTYVAYLHTQYLATSTQIRIDGAEDFRIWTPRPVKSTNKPQLVHIFTSYTTINIIIHTIKCYKFNKAIELVALNCVNCNINCCIWRKYMY